MVALVSEAPIIEAIVGIPISNIEHIAPLKERCHLSLKVYGAIGDVWANPNPIAIPDNDINEADAKDLQKLLYLFEGFVKELIKCYSTKAG